jgi:hypothetical protein
VIDTLQQALNSVQVAEPVTAGRLQVFGLKWDVPAGLSYTTLEEALTAHVLTVTEVSESGSVPTLKLTNGGDVMVLLMAGEQLIGAKQNRVLNASIMAAERSEMAVPVSCVERGRWGYRSRAFSSRGSCSHSYLRAMMSKSSLDGYRSTGRPSSDQGQVWREVDRKLQAMAAASASAALEQVYEDRSAELEQAARQVQVPADCSGVAFAFDGRIAGLDLFDRPATLVKLLPKLAKAYVIDALERPPAAPVERAAVENWLHSAATARFERFASPGLGDDVRIESNECVGAGLVVNGQPVHVELFPAAPRK